MRRQTNALVAALLLLPLGQPLLLGSTTVLATTAVVLSNQAADAQSAAYATYYNSGLAKGRSGNHQGAIADFNKAIAINPKLAIAYGDRGVSKKALGDYQGAIADYNKAIEINPQYTDASASSIQRWG